MTKYRIDVMAMPVDKAIEQAFNFFMMEIQPKIQPWSDKLNKKLLASPLTKDLDPKKYFTYLRNVKKNIDLFREANIPIQAELNVMQQQFGVIAGKMTIEVKGKEYTLQQAAKFLENHDRSVREAAAGLQGAPAPFAPQQCAFVAFATR